MVALTYCSISPCEWAKVQCFPLGHELWVVRSLHMLVLYRVWTVLALFGSPVLRWLWRLMNFKSPVVTWQDELRDSSKTVQSEHVVSEMNMTSIVRPFGLVHGGHSCRKALRTLCAKVIALLFRSCCSETSVMHCHWKRKYISFDTISTVYSLGHLVIHQLRMQILGISEPSHPPCCLYGLRLMF